MTEIAWDGNILAADSMVTTGNRINYRRKIRLEFQEPSEDYPDGQYGILAGAGLLLDTDYLTAWWKNQHEQPYPWSENPDYSELIVITNESISVFNSQQKEPISFKLGSLQAWGAGEDVALGVLQAGKSAVEAVKICIKHCSGCGGDIQYCELTHDHDKRHIQYLRSAVTYTPHDSLNADMY